MSPALRQAMVPSVALGRRIAPLAAAAPLTREAWKPPSIAQAAVWPVVGYAPRVLLLTWETKASPAPATGV